MAKSVSTEELQFRKRARRRLIGAITLVVIAVVVLPMVLDREPQPVTQAVDVRIPSKEQAAPLPEPPPAPAPAEPPAAPAPAQPAEKAAAPSPSAPTKPEPKPAPAKASEAPAAKPAPAKPAAREAFVVQLGAFSSAENAKQLKDKLAAGGIRAYTETIATAQGKQTRVRAGPYPSREAAEKTLAQVKQLGLDGIVTTQ